MYSMSCATDLKFCPCFIKEKNFLEVLVLERDVSLVARWVEVEVRFWMVWHAEIVYLCDQLRIPVWRLPFK